MYLATYMMFLFSVPCADAIASVRMILNEQRNISVDRFEELIPLIEEIYCMTSITLQDAAKL